MMGPSHAESTYFFKNGFWQTSRRWSLPFWRSITLASQRICVAKARAFSMAPTSSERTTQPYKTKHVSTKY